MRLILNKSIFIFLFVLLFFSGTGQEDTLKKKKFSITTNKDSAVLFAGARVTEKEVDDEVGKLEIGGYVSTYYSHYTDETNIGGFVQFPTMQPRNNQFGLNMALLSMNYVSKKVRGSLNLHVGDIAESVWPQPYNMIQNAHVGVKLVKGLWIDAGFFRSHIGLESTQPRENVTSSMAILSFFEPYYFSGAKLTYHINNKLSLQLNAFNSFGGFVETNKNKALGFSAVYEPTENISVTYNLLTADETPDNIPIKHQRVYNNIYATFKINKFSLGMEMNYGTQSNTLLTDTTKMAMMYSGLLVARYQLLKKIAIYSRGEYFSDPSGLLKESVSTGNFIYGGTFGFEYKPVRNVSISCEGRALESDKLIFKTNGYYLNQRYEATCCLDIWF